MSQTLITVAPTGAEHLKADVPQLPTTLDELVAEAKACEAAGAALIHVHIRDGEHRPTLDLARLRDTVAALREQTSLIVQLSTGGSVHDPLENRLRVRFGLDGVPLIIDFVERGERRASVPSTHGAGRAPAQAMQRRD